MMRSADESPPRICRGENRTAFKWSPVTVQWSLGRGSYGAWWQDLVT
jgi:hypothetical protein